ncbi:glutathione S-transferase family protein [Temperatibacter marinus]|uniref:Glutathione S-transferase family protein n=1 Tax=Temperatibacter marinus TaxID=1456591 RepID=A0AA52EH40_9PROT|nr:glutathione S-transferase family protein [Temperatibacter marinus]WND03553.1 glutathione S-transferase family protein [Temperatibacter marinus]
MKVYSGNLSPYATRVRIQIKIKGLDIEIAPPPFALRTPEFYEKFSLGKIPVLELDDGSLIQDSWVIMNYLEDLYPSTPLRPVSAEDKAAMIVLMRFADTYLSPVLFPLFLALNNRPDEKALSGMLSALRTELVKLDRILEEQGCPEERALTLGDIALAPNLFFVIAIAPIFGENSILDDLDQIQRWWQWVNKNEHVAHGINEISDALKAMA